MYQCQCHHPPLAGLCVHWRKCSTVSTQYQLVSTSINWYQDGWHWLSLQSHSVKKSPFLVILQEKWLFGCLWLRPRIRTHNNFNLSEAKQPFGPVSVNLLALYQSSCSNSHSKMKSMKVPQGHRPADLCLDKTRFLFTAEVTYSLQSALWNGKGRPSKLVALVSLSTLSSMQWWPPQGLAKKV